MDGERDLPWDSLWDFVLGDAELDEPEWQQYRRKKKRELREKAAAVGAGWRKPEKRSSASWYSVSEDKKKNAKKSSKQSAGYKRWLGRRKARKAEDASLSSTSAIKSTHENHLYTQSFVRGRAVRDQPELSEKGKHGGGIPMRRSRSFSLRRRGEEECVKGDTSSVSSKGRRLSWTGRRQKSESGSSMPSYLFPDDHSPSGLRRSNSRTSWRTERTETETLSTRSRSIDARDLSTNKQIRGRQMSPAAWVPRTRSSSRNRRSQKDKKTRSLSAPPEKRRSAIREYDPFMYSGSKTAFSDEVRKARTNLFDLEASNSWTSADQEFLWNARH